MKFLLTPVQARKLHDAIKAKKKCTLTLSASKQSPSGIDLPLSEKQIGLLADGRPHKITFSDKSGGFLPLIPILAGLLGAGAAATTIGKNVYDMAKGKGICPRAANIGKGIVQSAKNIFLSPQFLSLVAKEMGKSGQGIILGPSCGKGLMLGPPKHHY